MAQVIVNALVEGVKEIVRHINEILQYVVSSFK